jgi:hypothetical protein
VIDGELNVAGTILLRSHVQLATEKNDLDVASHEVLRVANDCSPAFGQHLRLSRNPEMSAEETKWQSSHEWSPGQSGRPAHFALALSLLW